MTDEGIALIERRIANHIARLRAITRKEINAASEVLSPAVDDVCGVSGVAGTRGGLCDPPESACGIPDASDELLDCE
jgi:hypothetical protein